MPVKPATLEAEIKRIMVEDQPKQKVGRPHLSKYVRHGGAYL
jgi:hypothetical protein